MSSTYFRGVKIFKSEFVPWTSRPESTETIYAMIVDTAESNVRNYNGGLCWHEWVFKVGTYEQLMRIVCESSYDFEVGNCQWKPANKTPEGFIHTCRNAIKNADSNYNLGYQTFRSFDKVGKKHLIPLIEKLGELDGLRLEDNTYYLSLQSNDIKLMYLINAFIRECEEDCGDMTPFEYAKKYASHRGYIPFNCPQITKIFAKENSEKELAS